MKILITGICGFAGHHIAEHILINTDWDIVGIDKLSYAANGFDRLRDAIGYPHPRVNLFSTDFTQPFPCGLIKEMGEVDYILHVGAETHVDNSIKDPMSFVFANVVGTGRVLEYARQLKNLKKFIYFSTDEVFGAPIGISYKEWDRYNSTNPYSATKAGGEELSLSYSNTYKIPLAVTHTMNIFGERQHPEKFIPMIINKVMKGETVTIHSNKERTQAGSRFYIHARNVASAVLFLLQNKIEFRDKFNIVGECEVDNLVMAQFIAKVLGKELKYEMVDFHSSAPGHDLRYALDGTKMQELGWNIPKNFEESLTKTINWYINNPNWLAW